MKITDLRIGNYLFDRDENLCRVESISLDGFKAPCIEGGLTKLPNKPIPLTEWWLEKFGFKNNKPNEKFFVKNNSFGVSADGNKFRFVQGNFVCQLILRDLKYVHQLQNLYFVLTGEELILNK